MLGFNLWENSTQQWVCTLSVLVGPQVDEQQVRQQIRHVLAHEIPLVRWSTIEVLKDQVA